MEILLPSVGIAHSGPYGLLIHVVFRELVMRLLVDVILQAPIMGVVGAWELDISLGFLLRDFDKDGLHRHRYLNTTSAIL